MSLALLLRGRSAVSSMSPFHFVALSLFLLSFCSGPSITRCEAFFTPKIAHTLKSDGILVAQSVNSISSSHGTCKQRLGELEHKVQWSGRRRRNRGAPTTTSMAAYNPNDELRAIVQRKQFEIKGLLAAHTATDDRLQVRMRKLVTRESASVAPVSNHRYI